MPKRSIKGKPPAQKSAKDTADNASIFEAVEQDVELTAEQIEDAAGRALRSLGILKPKSKPRAAKPAGIRPSTTRKVVPKPRRPKP